MEAALSGGVCHRTVYLDCQSHRDRGLCRLGGPHGPEKGDGPVWGVHSGAGHRRGRRGDPGPDFGADAPHGLSGPHQRPGGSGGVRRLFSGTGAAAAHVQARPVQPPAVLDGRPGPGGFHGGGVQIAYEAVAEPTLFLLVFVAVVTGVGGGVLRDQLAGDTPYIFVKHVYASASLAGAILCAGLWSRLGSMAAMLLGLTVVVLIRGLAAHFRWNLPRSKV